MTSLPTITEFLEARIAEDEQQAAKHHESANRYGWGSYTAHVLAECAAKRAIVAAAVNYSPELEHGDNGEWAFDITLRALASVYGDHRDYRQEWVA